jgi:hypothetical protein
LLLHQVLLSRNAKRKSFFLLYHVTVLLVKEKRMAYVCSP